MRISNITMNNFNFYTEGAKHALKASYFVALAAASQCKRSGNPEFGDAWKDLALRLKQVCPEWFPDTPAHIIPAHITPAHITPERTDSTAELSITTTGATDATKEQDANKNDPADRRLDPAALAIFVQEAETTAVNAVGTGKEWRSVYSMLYDEYPHYKPASFTVTCGIIARLKSFNSLLMKSVAKQHPRLVRTEALATIREYQRDPAFWNNVVKKAESVYRIFGGSAVLYGYFYTLNQEPYEPYSPNEPFVRLFFDTLTDTAHSWSPLLNKMRCACAVSPQACVGLRLGPNTYEVAGWRSENQRNVLIKELKANMQALQAYVRLNKDKIEECVRFAMSLSDYLKKASFPVTFSDYLEDAVFPPCNVQLGDMSATMRKDGKYQLPPAPLREYIKSLFKSVPGEKSTKS